MATYVPEWWNTNYPFRSFLTIDPEGDIIPAGHPVMLTLTLDETVGSAITRNDFLDVEILYTSADNATPIWQILGHKVTTTSTDVTITFNLVEELSEKSEGEYFFYSGNSALHDIDEIDEPDYDDNKYAITADPTVAASGLSFVRPGEYWIDGASSVPNAVATFTFFGPRVRLNMVNDSSGGIALITFDDEEPVQIDTYATTETVVTAFERDNLERVDHTLQITVTGQKSAKAIANEVMIESFQYAKYISVIEAQSQVYSPTSPFSFFSGA